MTTKKDDYTTFQCPVHLLLVSEPDFLSHHVYQIQTEFFYEHDMREQVVILTSPIYNPGNLRFGYIRAFDHFVLLSDKRLEKFRVWRESEQCYLFPWYVLDERGQIGYAYPKIKPRTHLKHTHVVLE